VNNAEGRVKVDFCRGEDLTDHCDIVDPFLYSQKNNKWTSTRRCK